MNTLSIAVFAAVCAYASAGLLGAQVAYAPSATYSKYEYNILSLRSPHFPICPSSSLRSGSQVAFNKPLLLQLPSLKNRCPNPSSVNKSVAQQIAVPAAHLLHLTYFQFAYASFKNRVSNCPSSRLCPSSTSSICSTSIASPALSYGSIGYGYNGALAGGLIH
ncbi:hypothetical protein Ocin01_16704 [Orchesella cincta]|uniref:Uncharacterized protein n=1 Tax=Orchesella cincta TaxID=48709 RepID=A0A1D2MAI3_ORCCI|nr:hypothetical protein Ocin01_16704 [Orchesella cincta]